MSSEIPGFDEILDRLEEEGEKHMAECFKGVFRKTIGLLRENKDALEKAGVDAVREALAFISNGDEDAARRKLIAVSDADALIDGMAGSADTFEDATDWDAVADAVIEGVSKLGASLVLGFWKKIFEV